SWKTGGRRLVRYRPARCLRPPETGLVGWKEGHWMRELDTARIAEAVKQLCIEANKLLPCSLAGRIKSSRETERNPLAKEILSDLERNLSAAKELDIPI